MVSAGAGTSELAATVSRGASARAYGTRRAATNLEAPGESEVAHERIRKGLLSGGIAPGSTMSQSALTAHGDQIVDSRRGS